MSFNAAASRNKKTILNVDKTSWPRKLILYDAQHVV